MLNFAPLDKLQRNTGGQLIGLFVALFFAPLLFDIGGIGIFLGLTAVGGIVALIVYYFRRTSQLSAQNDSTYREFAELNKLHYVAQNNTYNRGPGTLFSHGHSPTTNNILSGVLPGKLPFSVFNHNYDTGSGKSRTTHYATVMRIHLPRVLPHMVIDSHAEGGSANSSVLPIEFDRSQRIELEGDFHQFFSCYAPDKYGVSLLSIIGPDTMWTLMEHAAACDIEIIDNNLYFYWPFTSDDRQDYERVFATVDAVLAKIAKKLTHADIYATKQQAVVHSSASGQGARLTTNRKVLGSLVVLALAAMYIFYIFGPEDNAVGSLIFLAVPMVVLVVAVMQLRQSSKATKLRTQLAQRFGKNGEIIRTNYPKTWLPFAIVLAIVVISSAAAIIQVAVTPPSNQQSTQGAPSRLTLATQRDAIKISMESDFAAIQKMSSVTLMGEGTYDKCGKAENNYKVNLGYKYICTYKITRFYGFSGDFTATTKMLELSLNATKWRELGGEQSLSNIIKEAYLAKPESERGVSKLPRAQYPYNQDSQQGLLAFSFIGRPDEAFPSYIQENSEYGTTDGSQAAEEGNIVDAWTLSQELLSAYEYGVAIEMVRTYHVVR